MVLCQEGATQPLLIDDPVDIRPLVCPTGQRWAPATWSTSELVYG
jgi:hypothetical protein